VTVPPLWSGLAGLILLQIGYPLTSGQTRAGIVVVTVVLGCAISVAHALSTRGVRVTAALLGITALGGFAVEAAGMATGFPFGAYAYSGALGPRLAGVPLLIPLAWTWLAWPAWLSAGVLRSDGPARVGLAGVALASWDLFLDPQMVSAGYWHWAAPHGAGLPGVPAVPAGNYLGWLAVSLAMMALLRGVAGPDEVDRRRDAPMLAMYLWTYWSSLPAHAVFLGLGWSALWGGIGMGLVAVPLTVRLRRVRVPA
jgi:putative membrane protein